MSGPSDIPAAIGKVPLFRRIHWRRLLIASLGALTVWAVIVYRACYRDPSSMDHWVGLTDFCRWSTWPFDPYDLFQNGGPGICWVPMWLGQGLVGGLIIERFLPGLKPLCRAARITSENAFGLAVFASGVTFLSCLKFMYAHEPMSRLLAGIALSVGLPWGILCYSPLLAITGKIRRVTTLFAMACGICAAMLPLLLWLECVYMFLCIGSR